MDHIVRKWYYTPTIQTSPQIDSGLLVFNAIYSSYVVEVSYILVDKTGAPEKTVDLTQVSDWSNHRKQ